MTYEKQMWVNLPDQTTPISAERLNHIEDGIYQAQTDANEGIEGLATKADKSTTLNGYGITNAYTKDEVDKFVDDLDEKKLDKDDLPVPLPPMTKREWELLDKTDIADGTEVVITDDSLDGVGINDKFKSTQQCFADRWVSGKTYYVGDLVIWSDRLWKCSVQTSTEEPTDSATCWVKTNFDDLIAESTNGIKMTTFVINRGETYKTPRYTSLCFVISGRASSALFVGSNISVSTLVAGSGLSCTWEAGNYLNITNTTNTCVGMVFYI